VKSTIRTTIILTVFSLLSSSLYASFEFSGNQVRYLAMGGTSAAYVNDSGALMSNPAGLSMTTNFHAAAEYSNLFGMSELNASIFTAKHSFGAQAVGVGVQTFGNKLYHEQTVIAGYSLRPFQMVSVGVSLRYYHLAIEKYGSIGVMSMDVGFIARLHPTVQWGMFCHNLNKSRIGSRDEAIPQIFSTGIYCTPVQSIHLALDLVKDVLHPLSTRIGCEYQLFDRLFLRAGVMTELDQITFGGSFQFNHFQTGYAGQYHPDLGLTHQFAIAFFFSKTPTAVEIPNAITRRARPLSSNKKVHINTATIEELQSLRGVGPTLARRIFVYRQLYGLFHSLDDFNKVKGVGDRLIEENKQRIVIDGF
jgi:competence ComEA-like helix-hairpin-helix protein